MVKHVWRALIVVAALSAVPGAVLAQTGSSPLSGGVWIGQYWPNDANLYSIREPAGEGASGDTRIVIADIHTGGVVIGGWGSFRPRGSPVGVRLSVAQVRGAEVQVVGGTIRRCQLCLPGEVGPWAAQYTSSLTVSIAQLDAIVQPIGAIGPIKPRILFGAATRYHDYGRREFKETVGHGELSVADTAGIRSLADDVGVALHLGSEVGIQALGFSPSVRFGDLVSMDARMEGGQPEPFLRHDLYLALSIGMR